MELALIAFAALVGSTLTLFSGFGLGTMMTPVFALFFPVPLAIAATAVVHLASNLFKLGLLARAADWRVVLRFGLPAALAALVGAAALGAVDRLPALGHYLLAGTRYEITPIKALIGALIVVFALLELSPRFQALAFAPRWLPLGGALSGFFGGLSGNQGALRSAFLIKAGLSKEGFVATGAVLAALVDGVRLTAYGHAALAVPPAQAEALALPVAVGALSAFLGAYVGKRLMHKVTLSAVQRLVAVGMFMIGSGLMLGWL